MQEDILNSILAENEKRWDKLRADYDPVTGEGLAELLNEERAVLSIPDFPVPIQYVPKPMMGNKLIKEIVKAGSIEKYISTKKWKYETPTPEVIIRRIRRIRHRHDFCNWAYWCIFIKPKKRQKTKDKKNKGRIRFKLNLPQLLVLAVCEKMRLAGVPIDIIILKARQWGGSTFCFFYQIWIMFKWDENHSFAIAAHIQTASETILMMLKKTIETYPAWDLGLSDDTTLKLSQVGSTGHVYAVKNEKNEQVVEGLFYIGTAEKPDTLRSKDIAGAHYSEVGVWPDTPEKRPEDLIADIQEGIVDDALSMQVMESTAKRSDDYFHTIWEEASDDIGSGGYVRVFISCSQNINDTRPIDNIEEFVQWLWEHKDDESKNGKWRDSGKYHWWLWDQGMTLEGINWYRYRRLKTSFAKMCNEAPVTPEQAFIAAGRLVFDPFAVQAMAAKCYSPVAVGELVSEARKGKGIMNGIQFVPNSQGNLKIWEWPDDTPVANRYVVAVDIGGENDTSDWSSVRVMDRLLMMPQFGLEGKPNIVAEMHYHTAHDQLAYDAARLAAWYNNALLVIESNTLETKDKERDTSGDGFEYILDIVSEFYPNLYARHKAEDDMDEGIQRRWGFHTNVSTKPKIIDNMKTCLRDELWGEPSRIVTDEMSVYEETDTHKMTAPAHKHDDALMATAILLWVAYKEMDLPSWIVKAEKTHTEINGENSNIVKL